MNPPFPEEILFHHILPRLPSKSLIRFRCVSKSWDSFIRHPSFLHLRRQSTTFTPGHLLFVSPDPNASSLGASQPHVFSSPLCEPQRNNNNNSSTAYARAAHLLTLPNLKYSEVRVQCLNGLLCFHPRNSNTWFSSHHDAFALIQNPTTRELVSLPPDESIVRDFMVSTHFGYDPVRDEFKVLRLVKYKGSHEFKVFTVGVDTYWRVISPDRPFLPMHCLLRGKKRGLCVNGAVHWTYKSGYDIPLRILAFDLGTERFRMMPPPSEYVYKERHVQHFNMQFPDLVEINGCLSLIGYSVGSLSLWILKDYRAHVWERKSIVLPCGIVSRQQVVYPICRVHTGEFLLLPYFLPSRVRGIYYDTDNMSSRSAVVMEMPQPLWPDQGTGDVDIFFYQESFRFLT